MLLTKQIFHISATTLAAALLLGCICANGQDVPPPPRPKAEGPSLDLTMKFIEQKLAGQGAINYVAIVTVHDSRANTVGNPISYTNTISEVSAAPASCGLVLTRTLFDGVQRTDQRFEFSFRDIEKLVVTSLAEELNKAYADQGHPEATVEIVPNVLSLQVQMLQGKTARMNQHVVSKEGHQGTDDERKLKGVGLIFRDEEMAGRVAKAIVHAVELCGGGDNDLFE
jgi:hypothetical protein